LLLVDLVRIDCAILPAAHTHLCVRCGQTDFQKYSSRKAGLAMDAKELFQAGKIEDAIQVLAAELRNDPTDVRRRTFLFELLCFMGELDRAEKQLDILSDLSKEAGMGTLIYRSAFQAERVRREMFDKKTFPQTIAEPITQAILNGTAFETVEDADPRIGPRLEVYAAGSYLAAAGAYCLYPHGGPQARARFDMDSRYPENGAQLRRSRFG